MAEIKGFLTDSDEEEDQDEIAPNCSSRNKVGLSSSKQAVCVADNARMSDDARPDLLPQMMQSSNSPGKGSVTSTCSCNHSGELEAKNKVIETLQNRLRNSEAAKQTRGAGSNAFMTRSALRSDTLEQVDTSNRYKARAASPPCNILTPDTFVDSYQRVSSSDVETSNSTDAEKLASGNGEQLMHLKQIERLTEKLDKSNLEVETLKAFKVTLEKRLQTAIGLKEDLQKLYDTQSGRYFKLQDEHDTLYGEISHLKEMIDSERKKVLELDHENESLRKENYLVKERLKANKNATNSPIHELKSFSRAQGGDTIVDEDYEDFIPMLQHLMEELKHMTNVVKQQSKIIKKMKSKIQSSGKSSLFSDEQQSLRTPSPEDKVIYRSRSSGSPQSRLQPEGNFASNHPLGFQAAGPPSAHLASVSNPPNDVNKMQFTWNMDIDQGEKMVTVEANKDADIYTPARQSQVLESLRAHGIQDSARAFDLDQYEASLNANADTMDQNVSYYQGPNEKNNISITENKPTITSSFQTSTYGSENMWNLSNVKHAAPHDNLHRQDVPSSSYHWNDRSTRTREVTPGPMEQSDDADVETEQLFICPICNRNQPMGTTQSQYQKHVLDCLSEQEGDDSEPVRAHQSAQAADDDDDRMCPVCNGVFPSDGDLQEFQKHVNNHFEDQFTIVETDAFGGNYN